MTPPSLPETPPAAQSVAGDPDPACPPQAIEDRLIYENQLISTIDDQGSPRGSITRDSIYM